MNAPRIAAAVAVFCDDMRYDQARMTMDLVGIHETLMMPADADEVRVEGFLVLKVVRIASKPETFKVDASITRQGSDTSGPEIVRRLEFEFGDRVLSNIFRVRHTFVATKPGPYLYMVEADEELLTMIPIIVLAPGLEEDLHFATEAPGTLRSRES